MRSKFPEGDCLELHIKVPNNSDCFLWIEDFSIQISTKIENQDYSIFIFNLFSYNSAGRPLSIFQNFIGRSIISVLCEEERTYTYIDVISKKISSENFLKLIDYVDTEFPLSTLATLSLVESQFGNSHLGMGLRRSIVHHAIDCLNELEATVRVILQRPRKQLRRQHNISHLDGKRFLDSKSLRWIATHPNCFQPQIYSSYNTVNIKGKLFSIENCMSAYYEENSDTYENRILLGIISSILDHLRDSEFLIEKIQNNSCDTRFEDDEIIDFPVILKRLASRSLEPLLFDIRDAIRKADGLARLVRSNLNLSVAIKEIPNLTPSFRSVYSYQKIFEVSLDWYSRFLIGQSQAENFQPIRSISKIFELFCLIKIRKSIIELGFEEKKNELELDETVPRILFFENVDGMKCELFYEPVIPQSWKPNKKFDIIDTWNKGLLKPDFLIKFSFYEESHVYLIADAKFTSKYNAKGTYLDELTKKYIHRLSSKEGGFGKIVGLAILFPNFDQESKVGFDFSKDQYSALGSSPNLPFLTTRGVSWDSDVRLKQTISSCQEILKNLYNEKLVDHENDIPRAKQRSTVLSYQDACDILGMIKRGDHSQDIAVWFGLNIGRVAEVKSGARHPTAIPTEASALPPAGPYPSLKNLMAIKSGKS